MRKTGCDLTHEVDALRRWITHDNKFFAYGGSTLELLQAHKYTQPEMSLDTARKIDKMQSKVVPEHARLKMSRKSHGFTLTKRRRHRHGHKKEKEVEKAKPWDVKPFTPPPMKKKLVAGKWRAVDFREDKEPPLKDITCLPCEDRCEHPYHPAQIKLLSSPIKLDALTLRKYKKWVDEEPEPDKAYANGKVPDWQFRSTTREHFPAEARQAVRLDKEERKHFLKADIATRYARRLARQKADLRGVF